MLRSTRSLVRGAARAAVVASLLAGPAWAGAGIDGRIRSAERTPVRSAAEATNAVRTPLVVQQAKPSVALAAPNLTVQLVAPSAPGGAARVIVRNVGSASAGSFFVQNQASLSCEAGKLSAPASVSQPNVLVNGLAPGHAVEHQFAPISGGFAANGCYWRIASTVDPGNVVLESSENDNATQQQFCVSGSCY